MTIAISFASLATGCTSENETADGGPTSDNDAAVDSGKSEDREQACTDLNAEIAKETDLLRTCKVDADCGKNLPTLGSCGCTHDLVGRADADIDALKALLTKREQYADIRACEPLAGDCSCPAVGGVACTEQRCAWVSVEPGNPCADLQGSFASVAELECGLTPDGVALCNWSLSFTDSTFDWQHSDVGESGTYSCKDGVISAHTGGGATYQGKIAEDGSLTFEGEAYQRKP